MSLIKLLSPPLLLLAHILIVPQDEVAKGLWRSNAQYCDDHH